MYISIFRYLQRPLPCINKKEQNKNNYITLSLCLFINRRGIMGSSLEISLSLFPSIFLFKMGQHILFFFRFSVKSYRIIDRSTPSLFI